LIQTSHRWELDATLGFAVALLTMLIISVFSYRDTQKFVAAISAVSSQHQILEQVQCMKLGVAESEKAEAIVRITGDIEAFKADSSLIRVDLALDRLRALTSDNSDEQSRMAVLTRCLGHKSALRHAIAGHKPRAPSHLASAVEDLQAESATIHMVLDQITETETRLLQANWHESQAHAGRANSTLLVLTGFMILFLTLAYRAVVKDIGERKRVEATLKELTRLDTLTGLANRRGFYEALENEWARKVRYQHPLTLAYVDLDNFKQVNDLHGHSMGDKLLTRVATTIRENLRKTDTVARMGGDEFAVLLPETGAAEAESVLRKMQQVLQEKIASEGWKVTLSIGGVTHVAAQNSADEMVRQADELMYAVKAGGKNSLSIAILG
jgi:diguanylate cyclase (GGDEF)-like protein